MRGGRDVPAAARPAVCLQAPGAGGGQGLGGVFFQILGWGADNFSL